MAHINPDLFFSVLLPMLQMTMTAFFGLSSPEGTQNFFSKLVNFKVDGQPFFKNIDCQLICAACRKLESAEEQMMCNHVKQSAHWLSAPKAERFKKLYMADPARALKEIMGIIADDFVPCFPKDQINQMFNLPVVVTKSTPQYVFVACDPSAGRSQMAVCIGYYDETTFVVRKKTA
jgi:hypothetical protein